MKIIDCRKMACPAPVVSTRRALEESGGEPVEILVDPGAPRENVTRFAASRGFAVAEREIEGGFALKIGSGGIAPETCSPPSSGTVMLVGSDRLGDGPDELGRLLMKNFLITLLDMTELPRRMLFLNSGVLLTTEGAETLEPLGKLADQGVEILSCGVCLDFFHRKEKLKVGSVTTMFTIAEGLMEGAKVVRI